MAINFNNLPKDKPAGTGFPVVPDGHYIATVKTAVMKKSTTSDNTYLEIQLACISEDGKHSAIVFDKLFDSDKGLLQYKLGQFIRGIQVNLQGEFTLADLAKVIIGKRLIAVLKTVENTGYAPRNEVNAYDDNIYLPLTLANAPTTHPADNSDLPFDASDATDANKGKTGTEGTGTY